MSYFPFFTDIEGADALIVGGGKVALRKVQKLLPYGPRITVAAPEFSDELEKLEGISLIRSPFEDGMLENRRFVIAATDSAELNGHISELCHSMRIPVNVVDDKDKCSFIFPSLIKNGELSIGISTGGASPSAAIYMRDQIEQLIPENIGSIIEFLDSLRPFIRRTLPTEAERAAIYKKMFAGCMTLGRAMNDRELENFFDEELSHGQENR